MTYGRRRSTERQLLGPCPLRRGKGGQLCPVDDETWSCGSCPVSCSVLEDTAGYLAGRLSETWAGISGTISGRRSELDDVLERLAGIGTGGSGEGDRARPIHALVISPSQQTRAELAARLKGDHRFSVAGDASTPGEGVSLAATGLPDLVLVHLPELTRSSLEDLADLQQWSPNSVVVVVSGLDAVSVGDLVVTSAVPDRWPRREPSRTGGAGRPRAGGGAKPRRTGPAHVDPPRSLIQEAMRQIGVPMRRKP